MRLKALLLADACNPEWPSLPVVGYKYAKALAEIADVELVTQVRNQQNISKVGLGKARVAYLNTENIAAPIAKAAAFLRGSPSKGWTLQIAMDYPSYLWFERAVWQTYKSRLRAGEFDIVHRITPMSPTLPSYIAKRCPVPFVIGPLNGNLAWPPQFRKELAREKEWLSYLRGFSKWMPYRRSTYEKSACILAAFQHTIEDIGARWAAKTVNFPEVGIDPELFSFTERKTDGRVTILFAGRLVPYKLPEVVVRAFAASSVLRKHRLVIAGEGSERSRLEEIIAGEKLTDCVEMLGNVSQTRVAELMRESQVFAFPSIRELGAGVVVEAMASGLACVVVNYGGPASLVDASRGVKVQMGSLDDLVVQFTKELEGLVSDPARIERLGKEAALYALSEYSWSRKAERTKEVYDWVLAGMKGAKPVFW